MNTIIDENLGYLFHPGQSHFGDGPLDVILRDKPTREHFDPEKVHVVVGAPRGTQNLDIHHPWRLAKQYRVCAGHIRISDRYQKIVNVFSFGGQVQITAVSDHTTCQFTSPAPFLELTDGCPATQLLVNEIDVMLAEQRARLNPRTSADFDNKLITIEPFPLYLSVLYAIRVKITQNQCFSDSTWQHFKHVLNLEITRLQREDKWPASAPTLAELIGM
ncbi:MAG: hypothetical protein R6X34_24725 [Chloroflexota bacterium]